MRSWTLLHHFVLTLQRPRGCWTPLHKHLLYFAWQPLIFFGELSFLILSQVAWFFSVVQPWWWAGGPTRAYPGLLHEPRPAVATLLWRGACKGASRGGGQTAESREAGHTWTLNPEANSTPHFSLTWNNKRPFLSSPSLRWASSDLYQKKSSHIILLFYSTFWQF